MRTILPAPRLAIALALAVPLALGPGLAGADPAAKDQQDRTALADAEAAGHAAVVEALK